MPFLGIAAAIAGGCSGGAGTAAGGETNGSPGWVAPIAGNSPSWAKHATAEGPGWTGDTQGEQPAWAATASSPPPGWATPGAAPAPYWTNAQGSPYGGSGGSSYASIAASIDSPTGIVSADTALDVATEFEKVSGLSAGGVREDDQVAQAAGQQYTIDCPAGGTQSVTTSGTVASAQSTAVYEECCYVENFCFDGTADAYVAQQGGGSYSICIRYDLIFSCEAFLGAKTAIDCDGRITSSGCQGADGEWTYVVEVGDGTFAVSGTYSGGTGTLEIRGINGSWSCTYVSGRGGCTSTRGEFTF